MNIKFKLAILTLSLPVTVLADPTETESSQLKEERAKIERYLQSDPGNLNLATELKKIKQRQVTLLAKKGESLPSKKKMTSYTVDASMSLNAQHEIVLKDLSEQQKTLSVLEETKEKGVPSSYIEKPIAELKEQISQIIVEKERIERSLASTSGAATEDVGLKLKIGTMIDAYYLHSPGRGQEGTAISKRNYDRKNNDFTLNLFEVNFAGSYEDVSFYADLDFGDFADQNSVHGNDVTSGDPVNHNIGQAYLSYKFSDSLKLTAGKMYTHVGYEVAKAMENWNYSRAYAYTLAGPFWHEGIALSYSHDSGFTSGLYIYDNWDSTNENNSEKTYGLKLGYAMDKFHFTFNAIRGPEGVSTGQARTVYEFNTQYQVRESLSVAFNGVFGSDEKVLAPAVGTDNVDKEWQTFVFYVNWQATSKWSLTPRFEIFSDKSAGAATSAFIFSPEATRANDIQAITVTSTYLISDHSQFRFELRQDSADENIWLNDSGEMKDSQSTASVSWLFKY